MFQIKEVEIKNFRSHKSSKITFERGINLIAGRNGAGKSSVLDAILVALYSTQHVRNLKKEDLIMDGAGSYRITLKFSYKGKEYVLTRSSRGETLLAGNGKHITGDRNVTEEIIRMLGSPHVFTGAIYVRQGEIDGLIRDDESREKVIKQVTQLEELENAYNNMREVIREFDRRAESLQNFILQNSDAGEKAEEKKKELENTKKELERIENEIKKLEEDLKKLKSEYDELKRIKEKIDKVTREIDKVAERIKGNVVLKEEKEKQKKTLEQEIEKLQEDAQREGEIREVAQRYELLKGLYDRAEKELRVVENRKSDLENEKNGILGQLRSIESTKQMLKNVEREIEELQPKVEELKKYSEKWQSVKAKLDRKEEILKKLEKAKITPEQVKSAEEKLENVKEQIENIQEDLDELNRKYAETKTKKKQIEEALRKLDTAEGECPVCRTPLNEHKKEELIEEYTKELESLNSELGEIENSKAEVEKRLKKLRELERKLDTVVKKYSSVVDELNKILEELKDIDVETLKTKADEFERLDGRLKGLESSANTLRSTIEDERNLKAKLDEIEGLIGEIERKKEEILKAVRDEGFESLEALKAELETLEDTYREWLQIKDAPERLNEKRKDLEKVIAEIEEIVEKIKEAKDEERGLQEKLEDLKKEFDGDRYNQLDGEINRKTSEKGVKDGEKNKLIESIERLGRDIEYFEKMAEKVKKAEEDRDKIEKEVLPKLREIRNHFRDLKAQVIEAIYKNVEIYASDIFSELTDGKYSGISLQRTTSGGVEKVKIAVIYQGKEKPISFLSGGELIALGLAFRLALSMALISGRIPVLILDEPTPFLDEERRKKLVDMMNSYMRKIPQVILVSHDDELKDVADRVILVEHDGIMSKVSVQEM